MWTLLSPGASAALARSESCVMITGLAMAAALHAVSNAP
jgi:hypothetical protein